MLALTVKKKNFNAADDKKEEQIAALRFPLFKKRLFK